MPVDWREAIQLRPERCVAVGCIRKPWAREAFCSDCWHLLPGWLRDRVWAGERRELGGVLHFLAIYEGIYTLARREGFYDPLGAGDSRQRREARLMRRASRACLRESGEVERTRAYLESEGLELVFRRHRDKTRHVRCQGRGGGRFVKWARQTLAVLALAHDPELDDDEDEGLADGAEEGNDGVQEES